ncbi:hypothetical protein TWF696_001756 [Orbilia brochopaga]|uniref:Nucleoside phosphorylase domain-containing protein n=1 Tax=Orbilia brochopaga TaxID=3140254 RepID=A0AAV9U9T0_9PEZI
MPPSRDSFEIAIICALPLEVRAVAALLDGHHGDGRSEFTGVLEGVPGDRNAYRAGRIGHHNVVLVHMPKIGKAAAAGTAAGLGASFGNIKLALLVGICGGVPGGSTDIRLGDIVIGTQVVEYDYGSRSHLARADNSDGNPGRHDPMIQQLIRRIQAGKNSLEEHTSDYLADFLAESGPAMTNGLHDTLYRSDYWHLHQRSADCPTRECQNNRYICDAALHASCEEVKCSSNGMIRHSKRKQRPDIHFGAVASGDTLLRSAARRDDIARQTGVIAFDMEAAGLWDYLPCIMVKSVCDYADSHKNKRWQDYAAVVAASCSKAILEYWE